jgi:hypothetical protein
MPSRTETKRRHHKLPQHFLKGFALPTSYAHQKIPDIWVYRKGEPYLSGKNPELMSVKDAGFEMDYYAYKTDEGDIDFEKYENILMSDFENPALPVLGKIRNMEAISEIERSIFARYVGSMITRGDWWRQVGDKALADSITEISEKYFTLVKDETLREKIRVAIEFSESKLKEGELRKSGIVRQALRVAAIFEQMVWRFVVAPKMMFYVTSDKPVFYRRLQDFDSELVFPISSRVTLSLSWQRSLLYVNWKPIDAQGFWEADDKTVETVRQIICGGAHKEIYCKANREWLARFINKY